MTRVIATAGKGGTGKTTTAAFVIRCLLERGHRPVLAVDADANSNLNEALGIELTAKTLGAARELFMEQQSRIPPGMTKEAFFEMQLSAAVTESEYVDMLVMGRPEGTGCYCYANNILRRYVEELTDNYPWVVVDNEAGLEHISRGVTRRPDSLIIVSDHARRGIEAAGRISDLVEELDVAVDQVMLVVNRVPPTGIDPLVEKLAGDEGLSIVASLPEDQQVARNDLEHGSVFEIPETNPFYRACRELTERLTRGKKQEKPPSG
jgi:CO dehydrogenase maturation factor